MNIKLHHVARVMTGLTLRDKTSSEHTSQAKALLMQLGDLDTQGEIQTHKMSPYDYEESFEKFIVQPGDLVFRGRGGISATVIQNSDLPLVVVSPLIIVRPDTQKIDSHYLAWALTNKQALKYYSEHSQGSVILSVGKRDLEEMPIDIPELRIQKKIGNLKILETKENKLLSKLAQSKSKLTEALIHDAIRKEKI